MPKLIAAITGVPDGEIYPREIPAGEDCPYNLIGYAESLGALEATESGEAPPANGKTKK